MLRDSGVSSHLITDHYHYLEDGGGGYHQRYSTYQFIRGQEGDPWVGQVAPPTPPANINGKGRDQDWVNRQFFQTEEDYPQTQTFKGGLDFLERNHAEDRWFLQIETFDPHEPFCSPERFQSLYKQAGEEPIFDWPAYDDVKETPEEVERARANYAALLTQCDENLGRILDTMDRHNMWEDTMLIVCTDHGFLLGEHNRWAKNLPTMWNEIAHTPFFVWDPRFPDAAGERREALVQPAIDLGPTLLTFFDLEATPDMTGGDLAPVMEKDQSIREDAIFGYFGMPVHYTDGRYVYMREPVDSEQSCHLYSSVPSNFRSRWSPNDWETAELVEPLPFSKGYPVLRRDAKKRLKAPENGEPNHRLFDLESDPFQADPLQSPSVEEHILDRMKILMEEAHAPEEIMKRYGFAITS
tara:strand:- start:10046 stop:11278 length:1233 start_codon:yes stop_codon:yes gene_type:complete